MSAEWSSQLDQEERFNALVPRLLHLEPELTGKLLFSGNSTLYACALSAAYATLVVDIPIPGCYSRNCGEQEMMMRRKAEAVQRHPLLALNVRSLAFRHPRIRSIGQSEGEAEGQGAAWGLVTSLLDLCINAESIEIRIGIGYSTSIWAAVSRLSHLKRLKLCPPLRHPAQGGVVAALMPKISPILQTLNSAEHIRTAQGNGHSDSDGSQFSENASEQTLVRSGKGWERLEVLQMDNLSATGLKSLGVHLDLANSASSINTLRVSSHSLDNIFMTSIVCLSEKLQCLELGTSGTKLTASGLKEVIEGCRDLRILRLTDVEGRLEKDTWSDIDYWPSTLREFHVNISDSGPHHSWALHHLSSVHQVPIHQLEVFSIHRLVAPVAQLPFPPPNVAIPQITLPYEKPPEDLLEALMTEGNQLRTLCLDWWIFDQFTLEHLISSQRRIRKVAFFITFPLSQLISMTTAFSTLSTLEELMIVSEPKYNTAMSTTKMSYECTDRTVPAALLNQINEPDGTLPEVRELRKFVRKLPSLRILRWSGRGGKGQWEFTKKSTLVNVSFTHAAVLTKDVWQACQEPIPEYDFQDESNENSLKTWERPVDSVEILPKDFPELSRTTSRSSGGQTSLPQTPILVYTFPKSPTGPASASTPSSGQNERAVRIKSGKLEGKRFGQRRPGRSPGSPPTTTPRAVSAPVKVGTSTQNNANAERLVQRGVPGSALYYHPQLIPSPAGSVIASSTPTLANDDSVEIKQMEKIDDGWTTVKHGKTRNSPPIVGKKGK